MPALTSELALTVEPALTLTLPEIAALIGMPRTTLYKQWPAMVKDGRLPVRLKGYKRPRFNREAVLDRLKGHAPTDQSPRTEAPRARRTAARFLDLMSTNS